ncbi:Uncharacterised protein [Klebsiella oxytoca]|nr:Uncharacterised protein [Klebsiella oxytoca]
MVKRVKVHKGREIFAIALNSVCIGDAGDNRQITASNIAQFQAGNVPAFSAVKVVDSVTQSPTNKAGQWCQGALYPCAKLLLLSQLSEINRRSLVHMDSRLGLIPCMGVVRNVRAAARVWQRR